MEFLSLLSIDENLVTYSYHKSGLEERYLPDGEKERSEWAFYGPEEGKLFAGERVSWRGEVLLDLGVDLVFSLKEKLFIDHISLRQAEESSFAHLEVLTEEDGEEKRIGLFRGETGRNVTTQAIQVTVGYACDKVILRVYGCYENFGIDQLEIHACRFRRKTLFPQPEKICFNEGFFPKKACYSLVGTELCGRAAYDYLNEFLTEVYDCQVEKSAEDGEIVFEASRRTDEGYTLSVSESGCVISAGTDAGFLYGVVALVKLAEEEGIPCCRVEDKPFMAFRGIHLALPAREDIPFFKTLIHDVVVPMGFNAVFLQFSGVMAFKRYPEINQTWERLCREYEAGAPYHPAHYGFLGGDILSREEVKALCDYIKGFGLELIPEVQSWGHTQYITAAYPFLGEPEEQEKDVDLYTGDERPDDRVAHCMCPSHEQYYTYIFNIIDEIVDVAQPQHYIHMGHDEIYYVAVCEACRKKGAAALYAEEVTKLNDYIKKKGYRMMIWSDMLHEEKYETRFAIDQVPKDIIMLDFTWYFHPEEDIEDALLERDFPVLFGNLYSSHFPRFCERIRKKGVFGGEISTWIPCNEKSYAFEGKLYEMVYGANLLWYAGYRPDMRRSYHQVVSQLLWKLRRSVGKLDFQEGESISFEKKEMSFQSLLPCISSSPRKDSFSVPVGKQGGYVGLLHSCDKKGPRVMWEEPFVIGRYTLLYEDGTTYHEDLEYGVQICGESIPSGEPIPSFLFRHEGYIGTYYTRPVSLKGHDGTDRTLYEHIMKNPYPEKTIREIKFKHFGKTEAAVLLFDVTLYR